jgi:hypothetical protein
LRDGLLAAGAAALLAACAGPRPPESVLVLPPLPQARDLIEFEAGAGAGLRYFVDAASLSVGPDGMVRYTLVARSPEGVENVVHEAMRCASGDYRVHAVGRGAGWAGRETPWQAISGPRVQRWRGALQREYFCPQSEPIRSAEEGVRALREGGHPFARGFGR